ncbi:hypothetical protein [Amycolatopsis sp. NPDC051071]|uniref:hypothetical protein n=1 Tax=Amycolatopsis sp. NPDC051071 TaxID=3154637 RepID=UPI003425C61B
MNKPRGQVAAAITENGDSRTPSACATPESVRYRTESEVRLGHSGVFVTKCSAFPAGSVQDRPFRTWEGTERYMVNQPRGPDGRWVKYKVSAAAVVAGGALAADGVSISAGGGAASLDSAASQTLKGKTSSKKFAQKGRQSEAWRRLGWRQLKKTAKRELNCGPHSSARSSDFFLRHPCVDLALFGEGRPGTRFTGENYDSRLDKKVVVIAEAAPAGGRPSESTLETAVEVAVEFPAP